MKVEQFANFAYNVLYGDDEYKYIRVSNTSNGMTLGVLGWTGYKAIHLLQSVIVSLGPFKSSLILGYNLRRKILNPYVEWNVIKCNDKLTTTEIDRISKLLGTSDGIKYQDMYVMADIISYTKTVMKNGIVNYGIATFIVAQYMNWVPRFSEDVVAICRLYANNGHTSLHQLEDKLQSIFNDNGHHGNQTKKLFYKILSYVDNGEPIQKEKA